MDKMTPLRPKITKKGLKIPPTPFLNCLGVGTGVNVWSIDSPGQTSSWAVKNVRRAMDAKSKKQFQNLIKREGEFLSTIQHENIVGFKGMLKSLDGRQCLAMEQCGRSLGDMVEELECTGRPFPPHQILKVVCDVSKALNYLHKDKKLLHGDIKSYNILVKGAFEVVKLCDLGVCVELGEDGKSAADYTGTMIYNAPEVINGDDFITDKAEIFSLGLVIWEMLALSPPHVGDLEDSMEDSISSLNSIESSLCEEKFGTRPDLPPGLGPEYNTVIEIFMACTEAKPEDRPSAADLVKMTSS